MFTAHAQKQLFKTDAFPLPSGYIRWFCATTSHGLVTLTFDLLTLRVFRVQCFSCPTHTPIFIILRLSVTELRELNIWLHFRYLKQSLRMRRVTWPLTGGKSCPHFWNPWPQFAFSLYNFYAATMTIKGSLYLSIPMLKRFSVAKKTKSSQNRSPKWRFFGNLRVQI